MRDSLSKDVHLDSELDVKSECESHADPETCAKIWNILLYKRGKNS